MEESFLRFDHLPEQIFEKLDNKSLVNSRVVRASWCNFIDARDYPWKRFQEVINDLTKKSTNGGTAFHLACGNGQAGIAEKIMRNSSRLNIDLNAKDNSGWTAFHFACNFGKSKVAELLMKNSSEFNIELNAKCNSGWTVFHYACRRGQSNIAGCHFGCRNGRTSIIEMLIRKAESLKLDLAATNNDGKTGYQLAKEKGKSEVVRLIKSKMPNLHCSKISWELVKVRRKWVTFVYLVVTFDFT